MKITDIEKELKAEAFSGIENALTYEIKKALKNQKRTIDFQTVSTSDKKMQDISTVKFQLLYIDDDDTIVRCDNTYEDIKKVAFEMGAVSVKEELCEVDHELPRRRYPGIFGILSDNFATYEKRYYRKMTIEF